MLSRYVELVLILNASLQFHALLNCDYLLSSVIT